jgi:hypothetical protein
MKSPIEKLSRNVQIDKNVAALLETLLANLMQDERILAARPTKS